MRLQSWFNPEKYSQREVECLLEQLQHVLTVLPGIGCKTLRASEWLPVTHLQLLAKWETGPRRSYPATLVQTLIASQARRNPSARRSCR